MDDTLKKLWDARPWQGYAQNPPSMVPQLAVALGLLNPTLGRATRDMSMAAAREGVGLPAAGMLPSAQHLKFMQRTTPGVGRPGSHMQRDAHTIVAPSAGNDNTRGLAVLRDFLQ